MLPEVIVAMPEGEIESADGDVAGSFGRLSGLPDRPF